MFGSRKKKTLAYPTEHHWSVAKGERGGKSIFVRRNQSAISLAGHTEYKFRVGVAVPLREPDSDGLPSKPEMEQLNAIEDHSARPWRLNKSQYKCSPSPHKE